MSLYNRGLTNINMELSLKCLEVVIKVPTFALTKQQHRGVEQW